MLPKNVHARRPRKTRHRIRQSSFYHNHFPPAQHAPGQTEDSAFVASRSAPIPHHQLIFLNRRILKNHSINPLSINIGWLAGRLAKWAGFVGLGWGLLACSNDFEAFCQPGNNGLCAPFGVAREGLFHIALLYIGCLGWAGLVGMILKRG